ncbi:MAG: alpha/beta hydrolase [Asgard group archaeon]|nr:alpha/beta hydrolase [Asgard group archaeon]
MDEKELEITKSEKFIDVGTHKLRFILSEIASEYTIVLESGGGMSADVYKELQDYIVKLTKTRVISYDRSGFGQSELGPDNFTAINEVDALKKSLETLELKNKFILVGHSFGGFLVQLFTFQYPKLVSGLVLIDPMNVRFVDRFGLDNLNAVTPYFENPTKKFEKAGNRMIDNFPIGLDASRNKELPSETPIRLITAGNAPFDSKIWNECHEEIVKNSAKHKLIVAEGCSHNILGENPKLVIETIVKLVNSIKSK